ncbi:hypothetical protein FGB62_176g02 [Gracilaria domingensis]|nr:hypothetical protein FGB62_176g02 [Gracilaria domingensis]
MRWRRGRGGEHFALGGATVPAALAENSARWPAPGGSGVEEKDVLWQAPRQLGGERCACRGGERCALAGPRLQRRGVERCVVAGAAAGRHRTLCGGGRNGGSALAGNDFRLKAPPLRRRGGEHFAVARSAVAAASQETVCGAGRCVGGNVAENDVWCRAPRRQQRGVERCAVAGAAAAAAQQITAHGCRQGFPGGIALWLSQRGGGRVHRRRFMRAGGVGEWGCCRAVSGSREATQYGGGGESGGENVGRRGWCGHEYHGSNSSIELKMAS